MKAPNFPSYDEAVNRKSKKGKPLMTKSLRKKENRMKKISTGSLIRIENAVQQ